MGDLYQGLLFGGGGSFLALNGAKYSSVGVCHGAAFQAFFWFLWGPKLLLFDVDVDMCLLPETPFAEGTVMGRLVE